MKSRTIAIIFAGLPLECEADIADGTVFEVYSIILAGHDIIELLSGEVKKAIEKDCNDKFWAMLDDEARYPGEDEA